MTDLRKAAQQAIEAIGTIRKLINMHGEFWLVHALKCHEAADALRAALAEPDSDYERGFVDGMNLQTKGSVDKAVNRMAEPRPIQECYGDCPTNPQTCPNPCNFEGRPKPEQIGNARCPRCWEPITAPTPRKPLSEQELDAMRQADGGALNFVTLRAFRVVARAVERAHGIGE